MKGENLVEGKNLSKHKIKNYSMEMFCTVFTQSHVKNRGYYSVAKDMNFMFEWHEQYLTRT